MVEHGCSLLIKNLSFHTSPHKIRQIFQSFGKVRDVYLPLDHYTRRPRGFGFVEYYEPQYAKEAMNILNHSKIDGNEIKIIIAQNRRKSPETMKMYQHHARESRYRRHPYRSDSRGKIILHTSSARSTRHERHQYCRSKSRIMHKEGKREKMASRYRPGKRYSDSVSTYSASSSYRSPYSRGSNRRSALRRRCTRGRSRKVNRSGKRGAVRSASSTTNYSYSYSDSDRDSSRDSYCTQERDKGRSKVKRKNTKGGQRKGQRDATRKGRKRKKRETFSRSVSLSKSDGESNGHSKDGGRPVKDPQKDIEGGGAKDTEKNTPKDMRGRICKSYSTEEENQPQEQTHHDADSLERGEGVETSRTKKQTKSSNNCSEDTTLIRDPNGKGNSKEEPPQLNYQHSPTNGQNEKEYLLDRWEETKKSKEAKSASPSSNGHVNCDGMTPEEERDETYAQGESPPSMRVNGKGSNMDASTNKGRGSSQGMQEESSSPSVTKKKNISRPTIASDTNNTQKDHLPSGEKENGNGVDTRSIASSSAIEEDKMHLKEDAELCYLSPYDNANGADNIHSGEDCNGGNANASSRTGSTDSTGSTYRGCRTQHKERHAHEGNRKKKRIHESHSSDRSTTGEKTSVRSRSRERRSGKNANGHRSMMQNGRRNRSRITLSISESRTAHRGRSTCDDARESPDGKRGVAKRKRSSSGRDHESDESDTRRLKRARMSADTEDTPREKRSRQGKKTRKGSNSIGKRKHSKREKLKREKKKKSKKSKSKKDKSRKKKCKKSKSQKKSYHSSTYSQSRRSGSSAVSSVESSSSHSDSSKMETGRKHSSANGSKGKARKRDARRRRERKVDSDMSDDCSSSVSCENSPPVVRSKR
ncbi:hypothetical protein AK88_00010 [Plasmodium fragile]|uniref:RRM domain-containing protein n=1 Tax=Plasmodium fragile TaxID=5857 RepID=A0A0D9QTI5_PLAFR|nr:uncharacterized protein AK88_00010 [Plasmodium fragile]KJP90162.1 hypothetical protein AK88_00010 [Plasmodium fragile]